MTFGEDPERDKESLAVVEKSLVKYGSNYQFLWRASRACYFVGDHIAETEKSRLFERGIETGRLAISLEPDAVEGHFWLAANYGGLAEQKGPFKALQLIKNIRAGMETVLRLNELYENGGAYLALGEMDRRLPGIIGGNLDRAISRLEKGLSVAPNNLEIKLSLAEAYLERKRKETARRLLQEIVKSPIDHTRSKSDRNTQDKARRQLSKL
ncbi:MAG: TRAP transporter TatT component family protein [Acidobacteria bacterium]|nr:TRAP transporter TatT component family protein [Acidobacteriota bacterium]